MVGCSLIKGSLRPDRYDAYARYLLRYVDAYAEQGVPIFALTLQNEPHHEPDDYPGMRLDPTARAELIGRHLGPMIARRGMTPQLVEWDHNWDLAQAPLAVLADPVARQYIAGVAWHCYAGEVQAQSVVHEAHPDKDTWFTECSGGAWAPAWAQSLPWVVRNLVIGATRHWARGVLLWNLALDEQHGPHLGGCQDCRGVVTIDSQHPSGLGIRFERSRLVPILIITKTFAIHRWMLMETADRTLLRAAISASESVGLRIQVAMQLKVGRSTKSTYPAIWKPASWWTSMEMANRIFFPTWANR